MVERFCGEPGVTYTLAHTNARPVREPLPERVAGARQPLRIGQLARYRGRRASGWIDPAEVYSVHEFVSGYMRVRSTDGGVIGLCAVDEFRSLTFAEACALGWRGL